MSTQNPTNAPSEPAPSSAHPIQLPPPKASTSARARSLILVGVLALLLGALWYDYKVARPGVEAAFDTIAKLNDDINSKPGKNYVTEKVIQKTLNRKPRRSFLEGPYQVEVYSWRAGLPIRSHNYYAVYSAGTPLVFLKHYKFELPMEELKLATVNSEGDAFANGEPKMPELPGGPGAGGPGARGPGAGGPGAGGPGAGGGKGAPTMRSMRKRPMAEDAPPGAADKASKSEEPAKPSEGSDQPAGESPPPAAPASEPPASPATLESKPVESEAPPADEKTADEKPAEEKPAADSGDT